MKTTQRVRRAVLGTVLSLGAAAGLSALPAAAASAAVTSYCNSSSCDLATGPNSGDIYFEMPRLTPLSMICWTDAQWFDGSNRWFKASSIYGIGYTPANEVGNQARVGHC